MPIASRAWIMAVRHRNDGEVLDVAENAFRRLQIGDYQNQIRDVITLLGHIDVAVVFESDHDRVAYSFVTFFRAAMARNLQTTFTYIAIDIDQRNYPRRREEDASAYLVAIQTTLNAPDELINQIRAIAEVKIADIVWGDCDMIALLVGNDGRGRRYRAVLSDIANLNGVARVTSMPEVR